MKSSRSRAVGLAVAAACAVGAIPAASAAAPSGATAGGAAQLCNGQWQAAPTAGLPTAFLPYAIKVFGQNNVVVSGSYDLGGGDSQGMLARWNGTKWSVVKIPGTLSGGYLAASSSTDLFVETSTAKGTRLAHLHGTRWTMIPMPAAYGGEANGAINGMASTGPGDVWTVGPRFTATGAAAVILHYTGGKWHTVASNVANTPYSVPTTIEVSPQGELWLLGEDISSNAQWSVIRTPYAGKLVGNQFERVELPTVPGQVSTMPSSIAWRGSRMVVGGWAGNDDFFTSYAYSSVRSASGRWSVQAHPALTTGATATNAMAAVGKDVWTADLNILGDGTTWTGLSRLQGTSWTGPQSITRHVGEWANDLAGDTAGHGWLATLKGTGARFYRICGSPSTTSTSSTGSSDTGTQVSAGARPATSTAGPRAARVSSRPAYGSYDGLARSSTTKAATTSQNAGRTLAGPAITRLRQAQATTAGGKSYVATGACAKPSSPHTMQCQAQVVSTRTASGVRAAVTSIAAGYGPDDFRSAYNLPKTGGKGRTIAIVDAYGYPSLAKDLAAYRKAAGLPACTVASKCLTVQGQTGGKPPASFDEGWALEQALDVDAASAACPDCKILVVQANSASDEDLGAANLQAAKAKPFVISNSFGRVELSTDRATAPSMVPKGTPLVASTGDFGLLPAYPSTVPSVVGVGGTTLLQSPGTRRGWAEHLWSLSGGGCSAVQPKPTFQRQSFCLLGKSSSVAVVADADPASGAAVYDSAGFQGQSGWFVVGGTSLAAPLTAGMYAVRGIKPSVAALWSGAQATNPVTGGGTNGWCAPKIECTASASNYSGAGGWGSLS